MTKTIPAWAMAAVIVVTLPLTGYLIVNKVSSIEGKVTDAQKSMEALVQVVSGHRTELEVMKQRQESSDKFFGTAIENQASMLNELQRINRTIKSSP